MLPVGAAARGPGRPSPAASSPTSPGVLVTDTFTSNGGLAGLAADGDSDHSTRQRGRDHVDRPTMSGPHLGSDVTATDNAGRLCALPARVALGPFSAAIAWARSRGAQKLRVIPPSDGQAHFIVDLEGGSLELIGLGPVLQRISWMGDPSAFDEWASLLDHYAPGQTGFVAGVLGDPTSGSTDESVVLADRTLRVMAIGASAGTLLLLAVKAGTDGEPEGSQERPAEPGLGTSTSGTTCRVLA
jgi:hypothetical protein